jgi:alginate O-acetyltransferase complex protein AlgI
MLFNSLGFLVFLIVVLILYNVKRIPWIHKKAMVLIASYLFYGLWNPPLVLLLWISTAVDWAAGNQLSREENPRKRKLWLMLSMGFNLGFLGFFKYGDFFLENFVALLNMLGMDFQARPMDIILPMGISFYTFQTMSYTIDIYQRKNPPARTFLDFALYVTFFPQLVAGPIVRAKDLVTQFYEEKKATLDQFFWGAFLLTLGIFQKVVLADTLLSGTSDTVFGSDKTLHFWDAWAGTLAFSGQIFFDFAGYSTCAIGVAMMMGIMLPHNFLYPYGAIGFSDFWRRWHITLSTWLRDYLYIPLGGNRFGIARMYAALMITMLLGGLWHGAAWTFVFWGLLHGVFLVAERLIRPYFRVHASAWYAVIFAFMTFTAVNFSWVFFRAREFDTASSLIQSMLFLQSNGEKILGEFELIKVMLISAGLFLTHWFMRHYTVKMIASGINTFLFGLLWALLLFFILISQGKGEQFIYFQF